MSKKKGTTTKEKVQIPVEDGNAKAQAEAVADEQQASESQTDAAEQSENADIQDTELEVVKLKAALEEAEARNMRLNADFINFRKRKEKEMADTVTYANQSLMKELLPVLDDFERTLTAMEKSDNLSAIKSGIEGVNRNLLRIMNKIGLEPIGTEKGDEFDSNLHEAITTIAMGDENEGKVVDIMEKGYRLRDRIVRYARVVVGE